MLALAPFFHDRKSTTPTCGRRRPTIVINPLLSKTLLVLLAVLASKTYVLCESEQQVSRVARNLTITPDNNSIHIKDTEHTATSPNATYVIDTVYFAVQLPAETPAKSPPIPYYGNINQNNLGLQRNASLPSRVPYSPPPALPLPPPQNYASYDNKRLATSQYGGQPPRSPRQASHPPSQYLQAPPRLLPLPKPQYNKVQSSKPVFQSLPPPQRQATPQAQPRLTPSVMMMDKPQRNYSMLERPRSNLPPPPPTYSVQPRNPQPVYSRLHQQQQQQQQLPSKQLEFVKCPPCVIIAPPPPMGIRPPTQNYPIIRPPPTYSNKTYGPPPLPPPRPFYGPPPPSSNQLIQNPYMNSSYPSQSGAINPNKYEQQYVAPPTTTKAPATTTPPSYKPIYTILKPKRQEANYTFDMDYGVVLKNPQQEQSYSMPRNHQDFNNQQQRPPKPQPVWQSERAPPALPEIPYGGPPQTSQQQYETPLSYTPPNNAPSPTVYSTKVVSSDPPRTANQYAAPQPKKYPSNYTMDTMNSDAKPEYIKNMSLTHATSNNQQQYGAKPPPASYASPPKHPSVSNPLDILNFDITSSAIGQPAAVKTSPVYSMTSSSSYSQPIQGPIAPPSMSQQQPLYIKPPPQPQPARTYSFQPPTTSPSNNAGYGNSPRRYNFTAPSSGMNQNRYPIPPPRYTAPQQQLLRPSSQNYYQQPPVPLRPPVPQSYGPISPHRSHYQQQQQPAAYAFRPVYAPPPPPAMLTYPRHNANYSFAAQPPVYSHGNMHGHSPGGVFVLPYQTSAGDEQNGEADDTADFDLEASFPYHQLPPPPHESEYGSGSYPAVPSAPYPNKPQPSWLNQADIPPPYPANTHQLSNPVWSVQQLLLQPSNTSFTSTTLSLINNPAKQKPPGTAGAGNNSLPEILAAENDDDDDEISQEEEADFDLEEEEDDRDKQREKSPVQPNKQEKQAPPKNIRKEAHKARQELKKQSALEAANKSPQPQSLTLPSPASSATAFANQPPVIPTSSKIIQPPVELTQTAAEKQRTLWDAFVRSLTGAEFGADKPSDQQNLERLGSHPLENLVGILSHRSSTRGGLIVRNNTFTFSPSHSNSTTHIRYEAPENPPPHNHVYYQNYYRGASGSNSTGVAVLREDNVSADGAWPTGLEPGTSGDPLMFPGGIPSSPNWAHGQGLAPIPGQSTSSELGFPAMPFFGPTPGFLFGSPPLAGAEYSLEGYAPPVETIGERNQEPPKNATVKITTTVVQQAKSNGDNKRVVSAVRMMELEQPVPDLSIEENHKLPEEEADLSEGEEWDDNNEISDTNTDVIEGEDDENTGWEGDVLPAPQSQQTLPSEVVYGDLPNDLDAASFPQNLTFYNRNASTINDYGYDFGTAFQNATFSDRSVRAFVHGVQHQRVSMETSNVTNQSNPPTSDNVLHLEHLLNSYNSTSAPTKQ